MTTVILTIISVILINFICGIIIIKMINTKMMRTINLANETINRLQREQIVSTKQTLKHCEYMTAKLKECNEAANKVVLKVREECDEIATVAIVDDVVKVSQQDIIERVRNQIAQDEVMDKKPVAPAPDNLFKFNCGILGSVLYRLMQTVNTYPSAFNLVELSGVFLIPIRVLNDRALSAPGAYVNSVISGFTFDLEANKFIPSTKTIIDVAPGVSDTLNCNDFLWFDDYDKVVQHFLSVNTVIAICRKYHCDADDIPMDAVYAMMEISSVNEYPAMPEPDTFIS